MIPIFALLMIAPSICDPLPAHAYLADITYGTNNTVQFTCATTWCRTSASVRSAGFVLRHRRQGDNILIDEAYTHDHLPARRRVQRLVPAFR